MPVALSVEGTREGVLPRAEATYDLWITSGPEGAAFGIQYYLPEWPGAEAVKGSPLRLTSVQLAGLGRIEPARHPYLRKPKLRREDVCRRERTTSLSGDYWIEMPPNSNANVEVRARGTYPAWPGTKYAVSIATFLVNDPFAPRTPLGTASTLPLWAQGTRIQVRAEEDVRRHMSSSPELSAQTFPPLRHGRIALRAVRPPISGSIYLGDWLDARPPAVRLGSVVTDRNGRFRVPSKSFPAGRYAVLARSEARGGRVADWNCGPFFSVS
jgi:hypothetical protein